ncbi:SCO family protein [bacterium AH-315-D21]|nr:SCO family protein [bacterium AH-315-D21]
MHPVQRARVSTSVFKRIGVGIIIALGASVAVLAAYSGADKSVYEFSGAVSDPPRVMKDFVLTDQHGQDFQLYEDGNDVSLVFFGYAICPDVCPTTLSDLIRVKRTLGESAGRVSFIWITVDPERDSPGIMGQRIAVFDPEFLGLYGDRKTLEPVWDDFNVVAFREEAQGSAAGYLISHSAFTYLIDRDMRMRVVFPFGANPDDIAADVAAILKEQ